jgi:hypothetical protein
MGILDELTSATGDKNSNKELVKACLRTPALLHSVAEGLRTSNPKAKVDCALILNDVAKRRSELLSYFVADFLDASKSKSMRIAKLGFTGLVDVVKANPAEVYAERDYLLEVAKGGSSHSLPAAAVIAALCGDNANYRGKLLGNLIRLLHGVSDDDLPKWVAGISPAVMGSTDCYKKLTLALRSRLEGLPEAARKKLDKTLLKIEKSTYKKK